MRVATVDRRQGPTISWRAAQKAALRLGELGDKRRYRRPAPLARCVRPRLHGAFPVSLCFATQRRSAGGQHRLVDVPRATIPLAGRNARRLRDAHENPQPKMGHREFAEHDLSHDRKAVPLLHARVAKTRGGPPWHEWRWDFVKKP